MPKAYANLGSGAPVHGHRAMCSCISRAAGVPSLVTMDRPRVSDEYEGSKGSGYSAWQLANTAGLVEEKARRFRPFAAGAATVLDFGCGGGDILAKMPCERRIGVEANPFSAEAAHNLGIEIVRNLDHVAADSVDLVISNHALEHCLRPADELRGMVRVLRSGGRLVIVLPLDDWRTQRNYEAPDVNHHLYTWTPLSLGNILKEVGLVVESVRVVHHAWPPKGARFLWAHLPTRMFDLLAMLTAVLIRRRQILAVARLPAPPSQ
jgi:SAM-dependent methyltransferase